MCSKTLSKVPLSFYRRILCVLWSSAKSNFVFTSWTTVDKSFIKPQSPHVAGRLSIASLASRKSHCTLAIADSNGWQMCGSRFLRDAFYDNARACLWRRHLEGLPLAWRYSLGMTPASPHATIDSGIVFCVSRFSSTSWLDAEYRRFSRLQSSVLLLNVRWRPCMLANGLCNTKRCAASGKINNHTYLFMLKNASCLNLFLTNQGSNKTGGAVAQYPYGLCRFYRLVPTSSRYELPKWKEVARVWSVPTLLNFP